MGRKLLVIMSDEHQARALGCAGHFAKTPHLDALAARGARFTNAVTPSPICVPARASFATGRHVHRTRLWDNAMPYTGEIPGWGHALQAADVPVESIGKLHYRDAEDPAGFDVEHIPMMVVGGVGMVWGSIRAKDQRVSPPSRMLGPRIGPGTSAYTDYDQAVTDRTVAWLDENKGREDWCLYVGLVAPHFPLVCPQEFYDLYDGMDLGPDKQLPADGWPRHPWVELQNAQMDSESNFEDAEERRRARIAYFGLVSWLDHNVGRILTALSVTGQSEDTTVVYTSDHGDNVGARGLWGKSNHYAESVSVPLIVARPGDAPSTCATPVSLIDLAATIPSHFGIVAEGMDGVSLYDVMAAPEDEERVVFSEYHAVGAVSGAYMLRNARWKYIHYVGFPPELFDLEADPEELTNLAPTRLDELALWEGRLRALLDPEEVDALAHADQAAMIERHGGREAALKLGAPGATPPPKAG